MFNYLKIRRLLYRTQGLAGSQCRALNVKLDKIRDIRRGFVVQLFKGKKTFVPNTGFGRKPV